tara:strand:- start:292 stop:576 length:285 start_codon:yes stop_codon:yes gene_type:complete
MKMERWSEYDKYIVISDRANVALKPDYDGYLIFKEVKKVIELLSNNDKSVFVYDGEVHKKPITRSEAQNALDNIYNCKYSPAIKKVANFISLRI